MKKTRFHLLLAPVLAGIFSAANAQKQDNPAGKDNLFLTVDLTKLSTPAEKIFFTYYNTTSKFRFTDSATIGSEKVVVFKTAITEPILAQLRVVPVADAGSKQRNSYARDNYSLYIEPGRLTAVANDSLGNTTVTGSATHQSYLALKAKETPYQEQLSNLYKAYNQARKNKDAAGEKNISNQVDSVEAVEKEKVYKAFVLENGKTSPVALYALSLYTGYSIDPAKAQPLYDQLGATVKNSPAGRAFAERIEISKHLQIGQPAFAFTQRDTLDQPVSLASFKGKYVLIDFWASWCGPCRAENPNVVKAYNQYKDKDFTVLGVSLDRPGQKERWLKAIHDDGLAWTHVSDLKFWDNEVAKLYDVKAIPQNFLLDKEGKIIARDVRGEELQSTLQDLIK